MMPSLLGVDNGLTVTKSVVFDIDGRQLSVARRLIPQHLPKPHWVERDMSGLWHATAESIQEAIATSGRPSSDIIGVAVTAHGDGLYLLDKNNDPVRPGILSLDSRADAVIRHWSAEGVCERALAMTGQAPHVSAPSALLAWLKENEPDNFRNIAHVVSCKDWLRYCLTGTVGTDRTEASSSFTDVQTQHYTDEALRLFGLDSLTPTLPQVTDSTEVVGQVTGTAAESTGLMPGTPVVAGLHDVVASALGVGGHRAGSVDIVAGTYSINEIVSKAPKVDSRWFCRNGLYKNEWHSMSISPASAANYDWFLNTLCEAEKKAAEASRTNIHKALANEIENALGEPSALFFHPYLYGSPHGSVASAGFFGLRGWHTRGDMLAAVLSGIAFNHRYHIDALKDGFSVSEARLTGGISRRPVYAQLFADVLNMPVNVVGTEEAAAFGAALCAGAGVGVYDNPHADPRDLAELNCTYFPDAGKQKKWERHYDVFNRLNETFREIWPEIEGLSE